MGVADAPPKMGWEQQYMGKPGSRGHARMMRSMQRLRAKGATVST